MADTECDEQLVGYARVSTEEQSLDMQINALIRAGVCPDQIYSETLSGVATNRPGRDRCLRQLRSGMTLVVWKLDRVGRSLLDLLTLMQRLENNGVGFRSLMDNIDTKTPSGRLLLAMLGAVAQFERDLIQQRTKAGVARAMERGVRFGQPTKLTEDVRATIERRVIAGDRVADIASDLDMAEATIRKAYTRPLLDELRAKGNGGK